MILTPGERLRQARAAAGAPSPAPSPGAGFDPSAHTVDDVLAHADTLETADDLDRLLHAEEAGKARVGVLDPLRARLGGHR